MIDAIQARQMSKTNYQALENDLELHSAYFQTVINEIEKAIKKGETYTNISYRETDDRFNDVCTVLKWRGYKLTHYQCMNSMRLYYENPDMVEFKGEPTREDIKKNVSLLDGYFMVEW